MSEGTGKAGPGGARALEHLCRQHLAWERNSDTTDFQRRARLLQALWREASNLPVGTLKGLPRGAMLEMPFAQECLANYLTPTIRGVVEREVLDRKRSKGKVFGRPRIFANLLSSQPLCFNLFGEMAEDLDLATAVLRDLTGGAVARVLGIEFEHSPGRGDTTYTGDRSAFDVFIQYEPARGGRGFIGIEVKYHEGLGDKEAAHRDRYDEVAAAMGVFRADRLRDLKRRPLEQIWRDHLLMGAMKAVDGYDEGQFVFLYPEGNGRCADAVAAYRGCLKDAATFDAWTLEEFVGALRRHCHEDWVEALHARYLDFGKIDKLIEGAIPGGLSAQSTDVRFSPR